MKPEDNNNFLYYFFKFILETVVAMIVLPLMDMFFCNVIDKTQFIYSPKEHIIAPIMIGLVSVIVTFIRNSIIKNKNNKQ